MTAGPRVDKRESVDEGTEDGPMLDWVILGDLKIGRLSIVGSAFNSAETELGSFLGCNRIKICIILNSMHVSEVGSSVKAHLCMVTTTPVKKLYSFLQGTSLLPKGAYIDSVKGYYLS